MLKGNGSRRNSLAGWGMLIVSHCLAVAGGFISDGTSSTEVSSPRPKGRHTRSPLEEGGPPAALQQGCSLSFILNVGRFLALGHGG